MRTPIVFLFASAFILGMHLPMSTASASILKPTVKLPVWIRTAGLYTGTPPRTKRKTITIGPKLWKVRKLYDLQYRTNRRYVAVPLSAIIRMVSAPNQDLVLLHFRNKMIIPCSRSRLLNSKKGVLWLATALWSGQHRSWSDTFPSLSKAPDKLYRDVRPIVFRGNKIVATKAWTPRAFSSVGLNKTFGSFTPWRHVDSLVGIEFAQRSAYEAQFVVGKDKRVRRGFRVYQAVCQFCHGVRRVGAQFGWDFVEPYPIYKRRGGMSLFYHIKYRSTTAIAHGIMMPAIKGMTRKDAFAIWYWLKKSAKQPGKAYKPAR